MGWEGCSPSQILGYSPYAPLTLPGGPFQLRGARDDHHCPLLPTTLQPKHAPAMGQHQLFAVKTELFPHLNYSSLNTHTIPADLWALGWARLPHTDATHSPGRCVLSVSTSRSQGKFISWLFFSIISLPFWAWLIVRFLIPRASHIS